MPPHRTKRPALPVVYPAAMDLTIDASRSDDGICVLQLVGALDLASRQLLLGAGAAALADAATKRLTIDMAGVNFFDSSGIGALVQLAGEAEDSDRGFSLRAPSSRVLRVLTIAGLLEAWPIDNPN